MHARHRHRWQAMATLAKGCGPVHALVWEEASPALPVRREGGALDLLLVSLAPPDVTAPPARCVVVPHEPVIPAVVMHVVRPAASPDRVFRCAGETGAAVEAERLPLAPVVAVVSAVLRALGARYLEADLVEAEGGAHGVAVHVGRCETEAHGCGQGDVRVRAPTRDSARLERHLGDGDGARVGSGAWSSNQ